MNAYTTAGWEELFLAEAGASAALAGLLFVAVSINLDRILALRSVAGVAGAAIVLLVTVLVVSTFALVPGQPRPVLGAELLAVGIAVWSTLTAIQVRTLRAPIEGQPRYLAVLSLVTIQAGILPFVVAGVSLLARAGGGLYWLVPGGGVLPGGRSDQRLGAPGRDPALTGGDPVYDRSDAGSDRRGALARRRGLGGQRPGVPEQPRSTDQPVELPAAGLFGHTQIGITLDLYSHVTATMQRDAVEAFEDLLGSSQGSSRGSEQVEEQQSSS